MTKSHPTHPIVSKPVLILFGLGPDQKPRAAWFKVADTELVAKLTAALKLKVVLASSPELAALVKTLPAGKLHASGTGAVPTIGQDLYEQIKAAAAKPATIETGAATTTSTVAQGLPRSWDDIAPGHLVIAQETLESGWWEAIVLKRTGDMLELRWRDYPELAPFSRHLSAIALMKADLPRH